MKVYKDTRGTHDLEVQIERLQLRVKDLEEINGYRDLTEFDLFKHVEVR